MTWHTDVGLAAGRMPRHLGAERVPGMLIWDFWYERMLIWDFERKRDVENMSHFLTIKARTGMNFIESGRSFVDDGKKLIDDYPIYITRNYNEYVLQF